MQTIKKTVPFLIALLGALSLHPHATAQVVDTFNNRPVYRSVTDMPDFDVFRYMHKHLKYPAQARKDKIQGRVIYRFIVGTDGSLSNITLMKSLSPECDAEALRLIQSMPHWKPGKHHGTLVDVYYVLPVYFPPQ